MSRARASGPSPRRRDVLGTTASLLTLGACTDAGGEPRHTASGGISTPSSRGTSRGPATPARTWVAEENSRPGDREWHLSPRVIAPTGMLSAYASHASARAGDAVAVYVDSRLGDVVVKAHRLGHYGGQGGRTVWRSGSLPGRPQRPPVVDADHRARYTWEPTTVLDTTGWPAGTYLLTVTSGGQSHYVPLTIRSADVTGRLVVVNATATYQAYNTFGGYSLYFDGATRHFENRARKVSFDRPGDTSGARTLLLYEIGPIQAAERLGLDLAYLTSGDLDAGTPALAGAAGVVSLGHDEYWSRGMRAAVTSARDTGTNVGFLGANAMYWRVRFEDAGRTVVCFKDGSADPLGDTAEATVKWRDGPVPEPENALVGMLYEAFPVQGPFVVRDPGFFGFAGLGARAGLSVPGLCGTEVDRAYPIAGTPPTLQVVGHSPVTGEGIGTTFSDMTYYSTPSGAGVVAVGSMLWCPALRGAYARYGITAASTAFAAAVTDNLLRELATPRLGERRPARPDLDAVGASPSTRTGSGGPVAPA